MHKCDIPCHRKYFLGVEFPKIEKIEMTLNRQFDELMPDIHEDNKNRSEIEQNKIKEIIFKNT